MRKAVSYIENVPETVRRVTNLPLYAVSNKLTECQTRDDVRKVFRECKPTNYEEPKTNGIFVLSVDEVTGYKPIECKVNAITITEDKVFLSENVSIIGYTENAVYVEEMDGKIRQLKKDITFFTIC